MIYQTINLREEPVNGFMPTLTVYSTYDSLYENGEIPAPRKTPAVVICPGGAYVSCSPREAEPIAMQFCAAGFKAFVLDYCTAPARYPQALTDLSEAVKLVRKYADRWNVDPEKIAVAGFSAGGHLAASLGTLWDKEPAIRVPEEQNRPNAMILCYPVIRWGENGHKGSFYHLLGEGLDEREYAELSLEKRVSGTTPPAFIWHTFSDQCVPVENSLDFAYALRAQKVPFELHIYPSGDHGMALANRQTNHSSDPHVASWIRLACRWLRVTFGETE